MKKLVLFAMGAMGLSIFNACQKSDELIHQPVDVQSLEATKPDVFVENGYLVFKNMNVVDSVISMLGKMTRPEKEAWEAQMGFKSARVEYDRLYDEYDKLESYEAFLSFKQKHQDELMFNETDEDDCSIDYPYNTNFFRPVLNNKGLLKIGSTVIKYMKDKQVTVFDGDMNKVDNWQEYLSDPMVKVSNMLKSLDRQSQYTFPEDDPAGNNSAWHMRDGISDRRFLNEIWCERETVHIYDAPFWHYDSYLTVYLNQRGQKKSWGKWRNYNTVFGTREISCKINSSYSNVEYYDWHSYMSPETSSINFILYTNYVYSQTDTYQPIPTVKFSADVTFRGWGFDNNMYNRIDNPEGFTLSTYATPPGWGY